MFDRLVEIENKYENLADQINDPDIISNQTQWRKLMKEYSDMTPIVEKYREYFEENIGRTLCNVDHSNVFFCLPE